MIIVHEMWNYKITLHSKNGYLNPSCCCKMLQKNKKNPIQIFI